MPFVQTLIDLAVRFETPWLPLAYLLAWLSARSSAKTLEARSRLNLAVSFVGVHVALLVASAALVVFESQLSNEVLVVTGLAGTIAWVNLGSVMVFEGLVWRIRPGLPRIVPDVFTAFAAVVALMRASSRMGLELSGIIATSAVLTAVIGLALQDTLGNVMSGLSIQLDQSIRVDDWVKVGEVSGRVSEIRWRYTAIETRNWETVIVPNGQITKANVVVLGRRHGKPVLWRRWVHFHVDFRFAPSEVVDVVERALRAQPIPSVAADPLPNCIALDFGESATRYAVRYWLTDLAADDPTDSQVRMRIFFALARAKMRLAIPAQAVFVTKESASRAEMKRAADFDRRVSALRHIELFQALSEEERHELARSLHYAPFAKGETMTHEGADAHHLYTILAGEVSVRIGGAAASNEVARLGPGDFFGEMALLMGEKRRATCVAVLDVECYRLDASAFRALLEQRPELAERVASLLAERELELRATRERLNEGQRQSMLARNKTDLVAKIRGFFGLSS